MTEEKPETENEALRREIAELRKATEESSDARGRQMLGIVALVVLIVIVGAIVFSHLQSEADRVNRLGAPASDVVAVELR